MIGGRKGSRRKRMHRISQLLEAVPPAPEERAEEICAEDRARLSRISDLIEDELRKPEYAFESAPPCFVAEEHTDEDFVSFDDVTQEIENTLPQGFSWLGNDAELARRRHETPPEGIKIAKARAMQLTKDMSFEGYMMGEFVDLGSESVVQFAVRSLTNELCVVKFPHTDKYEKNPELIRGIFRNEADALSRLDHPNIVRLVDYKEQKERPFIFLEPLKQSLVSSYEKDRSIETLARILVEASCAVEHMHMQGIIYLDMKPTQFMTDNEGRVKLIDFGSARQHMAEIQEDEHIQFTPGYYILPSMIEGKFRWHRALDMYPLGKTYGAYALLSTGATWNEAQAIVRHKSEGVYLEGLSSRLHQAWGKKLARYFINNITLKSLRPVDRNGYEFTATEMRETSEKFKKLVERKDQGLLERLKFW